MLRLEREIAERPEGVLAEVCWAKMPAQHWESACSRWNGMVIEGRSRGGHEKAHALEELSEEIAFRATQMGTSALALREYAAALTSPFGDEEECARKAAQLVVKASLVVDEVYADAVASQLDGQAPGRQGPGADSSRPGDRELAEADPCADLGGQSTQGSCPSGEGSPPNTLTRDGACWSLSHAGETVLVKDRQGMGYIAILISNQGSEVPVGELESPGQAGPGFGGDDALDARAMRELKEKLEELSLDRREAERKGDADALERIESDTDAIKGQLKSDTGLRGSRRIGEGVESIRSRVGGAIARAIKALKRDHPSFGNHLSEYLEHPRGASPCYRPPEDTVWVVVDRS